MRRKKRFRGRYIHLSIPINLSAVPSFPTPKVSHLARSSAFPSLDLELDATLTFVSRMRRDYSSMIFEYEIVHRD